MRHTNATASRRSKPDDRNGGLHHRPTLAVPGREPLRNQFAGTGQVDEDHARVPQPVEVAASSAEQVTTPGRPSSVWAWIQAPIRASQGHRSASSSGTPDAIFDGNGPQVGMLK